MISGVESRAFKHNADRCIHLAQGLFIALRAAGEHGIVISLKALKAHTAVLTTISVNRHFLLFQQPTFLTSAHYSATLSAWQEIGMPVLT